MELSPTVRTVLTFIAAVLGALIPVGATVGIPLVALVIGGAIVAGLAAIGIIPPQTGGTQVGLVNPSIGVPPAVDIEVVDDAELPDPPVAQRRHMHDAYDGPSVPPAPQ